MTEEQPEIEQEPEPSEDKDITRELMLQQPKQEEQPTQEAQQVRTAELLANFKQPLNNTTAFVANLLLEKMARDEGVRWDKEREGIKPEEIEALGWGDAVIRTVDYYFPFIPWDHPLLGLGMAGIGLGTLIYTKASDIQSRAQNQQTEGNQQDNQPTQEQSTDNQQPKELTPW